jgi:hypothetical protein
LAAQIDDLTDRWQLTIEARDPDAAAHFLRRLRARHPPAATGIVRQLVAPHVA